jgi:GABA permease
MRRYLVVANQTLCGEALFAELRARAEGGPCSFHLVVPATHPHELSNHIERHARDQAQQRLDAALARLADVDAEVSGEVGDASPILAIQDALIAREADEIILSTLPAGVSRWLRRDLPHRVERRFELPLTLVVAQEEPAHQ